MVGLTHSITNAVLARLPYPEQSLATFTVIMGFTLVISGPLAMVTQVIISLADDSRSYQLIKRYIWSLCGVLFSILFFLGYTPAGAWVIRNILGLQDPQLISFACASLRVTAFLPLSEALRNSHQGLMIGLEKTPFIFKGILLRLCILFLFFSWAIQTQSITGYMAGSLMWVIGIFIEGVFILGIFFYSYGSPLQAAASLPKKNRDRLHIADISRFYLPLAFMMTLTAFLQPVIQAGIARSPFSPIQSLAVYGVARTLLMTFSGPLHSLHQCSLIYSKGIHDPDWLTVQKFCIHIGAAISSSILLMGLTSVGFFLIHRVIGLSEALTHSVQLTLLGFAPFPLIKAFKESYWGVLMRHRHTPLIAVAKIINILVVAFTVFFFLVLLRIPGFNPALVGALSFTIGEGVETLIIWRYTLD